MSQILWEPDFNRVLTVLRRAGEPDRVPFFELFHDAEIMVAVMGRPAPADPDAYRLWRLEFFTKLNYDYMNAYHTVSFSDVPSLAADDTEADQSRGQRHWEDEHSGPIGSWDDFERYTWPTVSDANFEDIEQVAAILPDGMKATVTLPGGVLENVMQLVGYEPLCLGPAWVAGTGRAAT